jgi:hypothetical protein
MAEILEGVPDRLGRLPMHLVARVGDVRVGIVHGDATALAGWGFSREALDDTRARPWLADIARTSRIDVFASTHTGLPVLRDLTLTNGRLTIINNGAAGMPNFVNSRFGLISRIATFPSPHPPLYGIARNGVYIDAIALDYDTPSFLERFLRLWPKGSPAHASHFSRIVAGPEYTIAQARPGALGSA